jgi:dTDP-4-amino-4,6-dideoxygalactose transaminase
MTEMQAAIGRIQLKRMHDWSEKRLNNAEIIWSMAKEQRGLHVPEVPLYILHAAYKCYVFVKPEELKQTWCRDKIMEGINELGVPCYSGSCSEVYLEKAFDGTGFRPRERLPNAKVLSETSLMFLVHPTITEQEISKTTAAIKDVMSLAVL